MLIEKHQPEDVFARVPELAAQIDPVLQALDGLLEDDQLYRASCARIWGSATASHWSTGAIPRQWK